MGIKFCKECKSILPFFSNKNNFKCNICGTENFFSKDLISKEVFFKEKKGEGVSPDKSTYATYKNTCPKCGFDKAEIIDLGVSYSDEDNLIFLKCGKCGASERIGRKTS